MENKFYQELAKWQKPNVELKDMATLDKLFINAKKVIDGYKDIDKKFKARKKEAEKILKQRDKAIDISEKEGTKYGKLEDAFYSAKQKMEEQQKKADNAYNESQRLRKNFDDEEAKFNKLKDDRIKFYKDATNIGKTYKKEIDAFIKNAKKLGVSPDIKKHLDSLFKIKNLDK